jgi:hypothetical protein
MIDRDRKILKAIGWFAGILTILILVPEGCDWKAIWDGRQALKTVFGPPNSGDLTSPLTKSVMDPEDIAELEKQCGGNKRLKIVSEEGFYSDGSRDKCRMIEVLSDGTKTYEVLFTEQGGSIWPMK